MSAADWNPEPPLHAVLQHLAALEQQVAQLTETMETGFADLQARLDALDPLPEHDVPVFPIRADEWEQTLRDLFGTLLAPPLVPVCARLVLGMHAKAIASELGRPLTTVKSQITTIRERFNLSSSETIPLFVFHQFWTVHAAPDARDVRRYSQKDDDVRLLGH